MSAHIGSIKSTITGRDVLIVSASRGGVELNSDATSSLGPIEARNYAALIVRAADEVERMRATPRQGPIGAGDHQVPTRPPHKRTKRAVKPQ